MSYEQFREQCAIACEQVNALLVAGSDSRERATPEDCAAAVRSVQLPISELMQKPIAFQYRVSHHYSIPEQWTKWEVCSELAYYDFLRLSKRFPGSYEVRALYYYQINIDELQSENAKLRAELAKFDQGNLLLREDGHPHLQVK